jgi:hypothetical protein
MGLGWSLFQLGPVALIGLIVTMMAVSAISRRFVSYKLVLRAFRIGFEPMSEGSDVNGHALSQPIVDLLQGEAKYAVIIGRPAGLINFLREGIGLSRRFEFALSKRQAVLRMASLTSHALQCSKLEGLNSTTVSQQRLNPLILFVQYLITVSILSFLWISITYDESGLLMFSFLVFCAFLYYYIICKVTVISFSEGGDEAMKFAIYPAFLERLTGREGLDMPLEDANRLVQIFRVLKDV